MAKKINQLKVKKDVNNVLFNAIKFAVESRVALYSKKNRNGLFSPFLFGEFLFWEGSALPKVTEVIDTINHFNATDSGAVMVDGSRLFIFVIPFDDKNKETQRVRCYLTTDPLKFSTPKQGVEKTPRSTNQKLVDRLTKVIKDFGQTLNKADQALLKEMVERYKA